MSSEATNLFDAVSIECTYIQKTQKDHEVFPESFEWMVRLGYKGRTSFTFPFYMGSAHISNAKEIARAKKMNHYYMPKPKPSAPTVKDVMHSLIMDSSACDMSFEEWASDYGYDSDSRKALNTYLKCQEYGRDIRRLLGADFDTFREALEDY